LSDPRGAKIVELKPIFEHGNFVLKTVARHKKVFSEGFLVRAKAILIWEDKKNLKLKNIRTIVY
jgi:hypothetical protein